ncbi:PREDICTED: uncharacterized protein LOC107190588 [Dufourea novaeangliae]|uniref:uncharacterized protein LOC107190588 n=1 Tax=Dufourea novaeangliae TaxID=178035 RepID=UPI0007670586|nr:PREDICTED: uncharacterized protein LOC107190588 [Dufourea novaeangliae]
MVLSNIMTDLDVEDSVTKLNTQLNRSMVLMDTKTTDNETYQPKSNKSIKINTKIQKASPSSASPVSRKSILKKSDIRNNGRRSETEAQNEKIQLETLNNANNDRLSMNISNAFRPHSIDDLIKEENLIVESTNSTFNLDDISDSEDIWIMDIPRTINPGELKGQSLVFGEKSKFKINEERYYAVNNNGKCNITCVFKTEEAKSQYKTVNVKPAGTISIRRKLSGISKIKPMLIENSSVPFPENLKTRHPLFGVSCEGKVRKSAIK